MKQPPVVDDSHQGVARKAPQRADPNPGTRQGIAPDAVALGHGEGLRHGRSPYLVVHHVQEAGPLGQAEGQVGQEGLGVLQDAEEAGEVG
nr:hypothetical protein [Thermus tenuipuniceus]